MIKIFLNKSLSVLLAVLLVFSTLSVTVEKHYCGNQLVDVSLFFSAEKCGMEPADASGKDVLKKACCKDTVELIKGQDELTKADLDGLQLFKSLFIPSINYTRFAFVEILPKHNVPHKEYLPPLIVIDLHSVHEVFII